MSYNFRNFRKYFHSKITMYTVVEHQLVWKAISINQVRVWFLKKTVVHTEQNTPL